MVWGEKWDDILGGKLPELQTPREKFWRHWARALAFSAKKDSLAASAELRAMREVQLGFQDVVKAAPPREFAVALQEVQGFIQLAQGNAKQAWRTLELAAIGERSLRYNEPPVYPRPIAEAWGQAAMRAGERRMAEKAFRAALVQMPASAIPTNGLRELTSKTSPAGLPSGN
jgi:hypothetical protein